MKNKIDKMIMDLAFRSTGIKGVVHYEKFGEMLCLESDSFCEIPLGRDWLFEKASDDEAKILLEAFIANKLNVGPGLNCEMARLLTEKGTLVLLPLSKIIYETDWSSYGSPCLILAGLRFLPDMIQRTKMLLDIVPEDLRDGLFLSIWRADEQSLNCALLESFERWVSAPEWGGATGETEWLRRFLSKWIYGDIFPYERMRNLIIWYFKHGFRCL